MDCGDTRSRLLDLARGLLTPAARDQVQQHLEGCPDCRAALESETALDDVLRRVVPRDEVSPDLRRRLVALASAPEAPASMLARALRPPTRWRRLAMPALAACLALALAGVVTGRVLEERSRAGALLTEELINDHLRVLSSQHPVEIESGGAHQVKPWFEGRLDFAPVVPAPAMPDLELRGGAVGYVQDRRAAVVQYTLRLHRLTLLVVRADGPTWSGDHLETASSRGFQVIRWRSGELGYALVSDVGAGELSTLAETFRASTGR